MEKSIDRSLNVSLAFRVLFFILSLVVITCYYYPIAIPGLNVNTKTIFAVIGLGIIGFESYRRRGGFIRSALLELSVLATFVSFFSYLSTTLNNTSDSTYVTYIISMWVWLSAAYTTIYLIGTLYKIIDVELLCDFLICATLVQCISAIMIDMIPDFHDFIARYFDHEWTESVNRLYGISSELDTAGIHFSVVLIMISCILCMYAHRMSIWKIAFYWLSFIIISVIGNMMARTTLTGVLVGLAIFLWNNRLLLGHLESGQKRAFKTFCIVMVFSISAIIYAYNTSEKISSNIRFGFEGFFSLVEKGEWNVASNNTLKSMIVFPDNLKTWLIGDGYMLNPKNDPYFMGEITRGYYKNTDIGYLRFIFYFGIIGLVTFSFFIVRAGIICAKRLPIYKTMIYALILLNFIVWLKVATDLFFIFALLYSVDSISQEESNSNSLTIT